MRTMNLTGKTYGNLKITKKLDSTIYHGRKMASYECVCICGNIIVRHREGLRNALDCGCLADGRRFSHSNRKGNNKGDL
jgi:hypothetical protein